MDNLAVKELAEPFEPISLISRIIVRWYSFQRLRKDCVCLQDGPVYYCK